MLIYIIIMLNYKLYWCYRIPLSFLFDNFGPLTTWPFRTADRKSSKRKASSIQFFWANFPITPGQLVQVAASRFFSGGQAWLDDTAMDSDARMLVIFQTNLSAISQACQRQKEICDSCPLSNTPFSVDKVEYWKVIQRYYAVPENPSHNANSYRHSGSKFQYHRK